MTTKVKLMPSKEQADLLLQTLQAANSAANLVADLGWKAQAFRRFTLSALTYKAVRDQSGLGSEMIVRAIGKAAGAFARDRTRQPRFSSHGAFPYSHRNLRWFDGGVNLWTVGGRQSIPFLCGQNQVAMLQRKNGEVTLSHSSGKWYVNVVYDAAEAATTLAQDWIGVDLGIVNIAVDSNGTVYAGGHIRGLRHRHHRLRKRLQSKGTRSAKRLLKKRRSKESRMARDVNHCISKRIVREAEGTKRGIALEDLKGITKRITVRKPQRRAMHSWAFSQLRQFIDYKAKLAGVPVVLVDPRNTSRTCSQCGHCEKANRRTQDSFLCCQCGFSDLADHNAAVNIGRWAGANQPHAARDLGQMQVG